MKRKIGLLVSALGLVFKINSQQAVPSLTQDFTSPFNPSNAGWTIQNNSSPTGTISWFQGNAVNTFSAYNGGINDYFAANYNSTSASSAPGTISNWLISPTVNLANGARIEFATRTTNASTVFPDRMQVLISAANYSLPTLATSVGSFTTTVFDVNSSLSSATTAVLNGTTTSGYPQSWTVYSTVLSGLTGTISGRIAFRYFVTNAGAVGANGSYIGLDAVKYYEACDALPLTITASNTNTICSGTPVTLSVSTSGTATINSYNWSSGPTTSTAVVTPSATSVYTVTAISPAGCVGTQTVSVSVTATPSLTVPSFTICSGSTATLSANGASSYTWANNSSTLASIAISPTATTVYTVTGIGSATNCPATAMSTVSIGSQLSMNVSASANTICAGQVVTLNLVTGASTFSWSSGSTAASFTDSPASSTVYVVGGILTTGTSVCTGTNSIAITVAPNPTFAVSQSSVICSGGTFSSQASGANSYMYQFMAFSTTNNPVSFTSNAVSYSTTVQYSVTAFGTSGCSVTAPYSYIVNPNPVISAASVKFADCINTTMTVVASGANSYTWAGITGGSNGTVTVPSGATAGAKTFTISGFSSATGCTGTSTVNIYINDCAGIVNNVQGQSAFTAFPNPFGSELRFSGLQENNTVEIYNVLGQLVTRAGANETIATDAFPKGLYIVKAISASGKELKSVKLIKN